MAIVSQCPIVGYQANRRWIAAADFQSAGEGVFISIDFKQTGVAVSRFLRNAVEDERIVAQTALRVVLVALFGECLLVVGRRTEIENDETTILCDDELADIVVVVGFMIMAAFDRDEKAVMFHK